MPMIEPFCGRTNITLFRNTILYYNVCVGIYNIIRGFITIYMFNKCLAHVSNRLWHIPYSDIFQYLQTYICVLRTAGKLPKQTLSSTNYIIYTYISNILKRKGKERKIGWWFSCSCLFRAIHTLVEYVGITLHTYNIGTNIRLRLFFLHWSAQTFGIPIEYLYNI